MIDVTDASAVKEAFGKLTDGQRAAISATGDRQYLCGMYPGKAVYDNLEIKGGAAGKFIDVLWFDEAGKAQFGWPLLADDNTPRAKSRLVLEYDADATIFLDYEAAKRRIVFDHLSPMKHFDDDTTTLGPDMSIDAYVRKAKQWLLKTDIRAKNRH